MRYDQLIQPTRKVEKMNNKRKCKTCNLFLRAQMVEGLGMCRSGKSKYRSVTLERGKMGNCGFAGKNWEPKE